MAKAIVSICVVCGKEFKAPPSRPKKFCCVDCYRVHQRDGNYARGPKPSTRRTPCAHCGKIVVGALSKKRDGNSSDLRFCDRKCYDLHRAGAIKAREIKCDHCGKLFSPSTSNLARKYCSEECWKSARKAKPKKCINCGCLFTPVKLMPTGKFISHNSGKTCSSYCQNQWIRNNPERKRKIGNAFRGENHPNWQGGKSLLNNTSSRGPNWKKQRAAALKRDGYKCVDCGITDDQSKEKYGRSLDVDHIVPFHNFNSFLKANSLNNLACRCAACHKSAESKRGMVQMVLPMQDSVKRQHKGMHRCISNAKLELNHVVSIRQRAKAGHTLVDIWNDYKQVGLSAIRCVVLGKTWKHA